MKKNLKNFLVQDDIDTLMEEYESHHDYISTSMMKAPPGPAVSIIDEFVGMKRIGGNYYKHSKPYFPHTDHRKEWGETINVVVPLYTSDPDAHLVVFDQRWHKDSVTWCLDRQVMHFTVNTGVAGRPCDYDVEGLTDEPISDELYEHLSWAPKEQWYGLSGTAMPLTPGDILIFDNKYIHATSKLNGTKVGLSLRYQV